LQTPPQISAQRISAIIPARNEQENIEAAVRSLAGQPEIEEIIVVDDESTDRTPEILQRIAAEIPRLKILRSGELPVGWVGKNHALWTGAQTAKGDWLLFIDADTVLLEDAVSHALQDAERYGAALVSYSPEQLMQTFFERALIPFIYCRLARKFSFAAVNDPSRPEAAANGQFILIRRDAYQQIGGHRAVAAEVLEDVALARRVKQAGFILHFAPGGGVARTRMYRSFRALWQGWTKNLYVLFGAAIAEAAREILITFPWLFLGLLIAGICIRGRPGGALLVAAAAAFALGHLWYARELKANRYSDRFIIYYELAAFLYAGLICASAWKYRRGKISWKGRQYRAAR
jgi:glycosyltransferase involved in cell wall biosynthesis